MSKLNILLGILLSSQFIVVNCFSFNSEPKQVQKQVKKEIEIYSEGGFLKYWEHLNEFESNMNDDELNKTCDNLLELIHEIETATSGDEKARTFVQFIPIYEKFLDSLKKKKRAADYQKFIIDNVIEKIQEVDGRLREKCEPLNCLIKEHPSFISRSRTVHTDKYGLRYINDKASIAQRGKFRFWKTYVVNIQTEELCFMGCNYNAKKRNERRIIAAYLKYRSLNNSGIVPIPLPEPKQDQSYKKQTDQ